MSEDNGASVASRTESTDRMVAFSDGVLAIAITLLVLDLAARPPGSPLERFLHAWPSYLAYVVSFLTIGAAWLSHTGLTHRLERTDPFLLRLNLAFLLLVSFLPFPTRLVAESLNESTAAERVAGVVYGLTLLAIRLIFFAMDVYTRRRHLLAAGLDDADMEDARRKFRSVVTGYGLTIVLALFVPIVAITLYLAISLVLIVPFPRYPARRTRTN